ncbi:MAG: ROK family protein [Gammaproteobacteria bacterium]
MTTIKKSQIRIGIDLGGTKIEIIALNNSGEAIYHRRVATPKGNYAETINVIANLIFEFEQELNCRAFVGIGMPGAISSATGSVKNSNSVCINGKPFKQDLELRLDRSIKIENDANCFALSEAIDGAAVEAKVVFGVILGTGVGGGLIINKEVITGPNSITGEWGHNPLPWLDEEESFNVISCYCGKKSCIETWLCGNGLSNSYSRLSKQKCSAIEVVEKAESGDNYAQKSLLEYARRLAKSLASVINLMDPDIIVLGGGLSNIQQIYTSVPDMWGEYVFSDRVDTRLVSAKYGDASGVRGAAWLNNDL